LYGIEPFKRREVIFTNIYHWIVKEVPLRHLIVITTLLILCSKKAACIVDDVLHVVTEKIILFEWLNLRTTQA